MNKNVLLGSISLFGILAVFLYVISVAQSSGSQSVESPDSRETGTYSEIPQRTSVTGTWECLPHRDTSGPQTMECAFGIRREDGSHLAVSTLLMATYPVDFPTGTRVQIEGILVPIENISSDHWKKYDIDGIIDATTITKI